MKQIIWITGFSGSGKTTIAKLLHENLLKNEINTILLDGDELRHALNLMDQYSFEERKKIAYQYAKLAKLLADQGFYVIVSTISMFEAVRQWNRMNNENYYEVYLKVPERVRIERDPKGLYQTIPQNMIGMEQVYEEPKNADFVVDYAQKFTPEQIVNQILDKLLATEEME